MDDNEFNVWIGCLTCYNNGGLVGQWYPATEAGSVTVAQVHELKADPPEGWHDELWCFDLDNAPKGYYHEMSPAIAQEIAEALSEVPSYLEAQAYLAWLDYNGYDLVGNEYLSDFEEAYCGQWDSEEDYAQDLAEQLDLIPKEHSWPASYIDWERAARDLFMDYTAIEVPTGGIWVFRDY